MQWRCLLCHWLCHWVLPWGHGGSLEIWRALGFTVRRCLERYSFWYCFRCCCQIMWRWLKRRYLIHAWRPWQCGHLLDWIRWWCLLGRHRCCHCVALTGLDASRVWKGWCSYTGASGLPRESRTSSEWIVWLSKSLVICSRPCPPKHMLCFESIPQRH